MMMDTIANQNNQTVVTTAPAETKKQDAQAFGAVDILMGTRVAGSLLMLRRKNAFITK